MDVVSVTVSACVQCTVMSGKHYFAADVYSVWLLQSSDSSSMMIPELCVHVCVWVSVCL